MEQFMLLLRLIEMQDTQSSIFKIFLNDKNDWCTEDDSLLKSQVFIN